MNIVVFTGAGISRESGLKTFRDSDGLWEGHRVEDVCHVRAWKRQPAVVLDFYNFRRREVLAAEPNTAHHALVDLESRHNVTVVTQNVDDLHERAGSTNVMHLHGEILKVRSERDGRGLIPWRRDVKIGDVAADGGQLRPHVVFFGEMPWNVDEAIALSQNADVLLVVGTSLEVHPAALVAQESHARHAWFVDPILPEPAKLTKLSRRGAHLHFITGKATAGVPLAVKEILAVEAGVGGDN